MHRIPYEWICPECLNFHAEPYEMYYHRCQVCGSTFVIRKEKENAMEQRSSDSP